MRVAELRDKLSELVGRGYGFADTYIVKVELLESEDMSLWNDEVILSTKEDL